MNPQASKSCRCGPRSVLLDRERSLVRSKPYGFSLFVSVLFTLVVHSGCAGPTGDAPSTSTNANSPPSITIQPANQTVIAGQAATFSVTASGAAPLSYQWQNDGLPVSGAISSTYVIATTTTSESGSRFTVVVSNGAGSTTSATATVTVDGPTVTITPSSATLVAGSTQQFAAHVTGALETAVTWTVNGSGCTGRSCGTISSNGLYVAPTSVPSPDLVTVKATSVADPTKSASASLTIIAAVSVMLSINPTNASVPTNGTQLFTANVSGTSNTAVSWRLSGAGCSGSGCGSLSTGGSSAVYSAPIVAPSPATVSVVATSIADATKSASAVVTIVPAIVVSVTPTDASVAAGSTQQFTSSVVGTSNSAVTWTITGTGCKGAACGTISSSGLYTAPAAVPSPATVTVSATSVSDPTQSASADVTIMPHVGTTYYLAPVSDGGNDSNNGLSSSTPWLTPNHPLSCGDTITMIAGAYNASNFDWKFGPVTCPPGNNVAWLKCATFAACTFAAGGGITVDASYWGVAGLAISDSASSDEPCLSAGPDKYAPTSIQYIIFADNVVTNCAAGIQAYGVIADNMGPDYIAIIGNIVYNAAQLQKNWCASGISINQPKAFDSLPGTHIYIAGNFSFGNFDPNPCGGGKPSDGEGIIFDTFDWSGGPGQYHQQAVAENNILVGNGGIGLEVYSNITGTTPFAPIYALHNTMWDNNKDTNQPPNRGEVEISSAASTQVFLNLAVTDNVTSYAYKVLNVNGSNVIYGNVGFSAVGNNTLISGSPGFAFGPNNLFGTSPEFVNPIDPPAPSCGGSASTVACMSAIIADFTPRSASVANYGYQTPRPTPDYNPFFPQWLCRVNLPEGLVTMGCLADPGSQDVDQAERR
jgi:Immunoglobulin domain